MSLTSAPVWQASTDGPGMVAVVDDDVHIAAALRQWLSWLSVPCSLYPTAEQLLGAIEPHARGWRTRDTDGGQALRSVVMDLNLPGLNGFEAARRLHQSDPTLCVVVITAASDENIEMLGGVPPGVHCLRKPFDLQALEAFLMLRPR